MKFKDEDIEEANSIVLAGHPDFDIGEIEKAFEICKKIFADKITDAIEKAHDAAMRTFEKKLDLIYDSMEAEITGRQILTQNEIENLLAPLNEE